MGVAHYTFSSFGELRTALCAVCSWRLPSQKILLLLVWLLAYWWVLPVASTQYFCIVATCGRIGWCCCALVLLLLHLLLLLSAIYIYVI
jgi:hypothetical protein